MPVLPRPDCFAAAANAADVLLGRIPTGTYTDYVYYEIVDALLTKHTDISQERVVHLVRTTAAAHTEYTSTHSAITAANATLLTATKAVLKVVNASPWYARLRPVLAHLRAAPAVDWRRGPTLHIGTASFAVDPDDARAVDAYHRLHHPARHLLELDTPAAHWQTVYARPALEAEAVKLRTAYDLLMKVAR
jgi:hypothetical protein